MYTFLFFGYHTFSTLSLSDLFLSQFHYHNPSTMPYRLEFTTNARRQCNGTKPCKGTKIEKGQAVFGTWVPFQDKGSLYVIRMGFARASVENAPNHILTTTLVCIDSKWRHLACLT
jgi:hypothetical protein